MYRRLTGDACGAGMGIAFTGDDMGKLFLTEDEQRQLWGVEDIPHGEAAARWESPDKRAERYRKALEGILACAPCNRAVIMLQAVAARALGYDALERELLRKLESDPSVRDPSVRDPSVRDPSVRDPSVRDGSPP